ncbi:hypothetical protein, partial [Stackebrandtia soli]|uniref:hypothetical protein n=1 Tax=Stackebrandtia soli TaxID=1892856 RepID=UPI0039EC6198
MSPLTIVLLVIAVIFVIAKRSIGEPLNARDLLVAPLILTGVGVHEIAGEGGVRVHDGLWLAGTVLVGLACGFLRGATIRLAIRDGVLWQRYTGVTFLTWFLTLAVSGGFSLLASWGGMTEAARPIALSIGIGMVGEAIALVVRAYSDGRPYSLDGADSTIARRQLRGGLTELFRLNGRRTGV